MKLDEKTHGRRTMLFEGDLHVGTIVEQAKPEYRKTGLYQWITAHQGGHVGDWSEAYCAILQELER